MTIPDWISHENTSLLFVYLVLKYENVRFIVEILY